MSEDSTPEDMKDEKIEEKPSFWNMLAEKFDADDWRELIKELKETLLELRKTSLAEKRTLSIPVFILISVIFSAIAILAGLGRIEGHYVTTIGGLIVGYMLSFLEVSISPSDTS